MEKVLVLRSSFDRITAIAILFAYIVIDGLYARYTLAVNNLYPIRSATVGASMHFLLAFGVVNYTENWLYIFPLVVGSRLGTYWVVVYEKRQKRQKHDL